MLRKLMPARARRCFPGNRNRGRRHGTASSFCARLWTRSTSAWFRSADARRNRALSGGRALRLHRSTIETNRGRPTVEHGRALQTCVTLENASNQNIHDATRLVALRRYRALLGLRRRFVVYVEDLPRERAFERPSCPKDVLLLESTADQH